MKNLHGILQMASIAPQIHITKFYFQYSFTKMPAQSKFASDQGGSSSNTPAPRKRNMDTLAVTAHERRYEQQSQTKNYYLGQRAIFEQSPAEIRQQSKTNREKKLKALSLHEQLFSTVPTITVDRGNLKGVQGIHEAQRNAIYFLFVMAGSPPADTWKESRVAQWIMEKLSIPANLTSALLAVLENILIAQSNGEVYNPNQNLSDRGRNSVIEDMTPQAEIIYRQLTKGLTPTHAVFMVNIWRNNNGLAPVSRSAVQRFVQRSDIDQLDKNCNPGIQV
jgi:hypothetical protein